ncbi:hypothetical protein cym2001_21950 [Pseudomonas sp. CYM-20-01]|nr:hypothetical protein cym2001_21950 [Pseudomonas sp. CYM-20-01]
MSIEGVSRLCRPAPNVASEPSTPSQPAAQPYTRNAVYAAQPDGAHRPRLLRTAQLGLSHRALQNAPTARAQVSEPDATWTDRQLAQALEKGFGLLHPFLKEGRLTYSALCRVAAE